MGYNLYIGEAAADVVLADRYAAVHVAVRTADGAPTNSSGNKNNTIWPSYTGWHAFCVEVGLEPVFYGDPPRLTRGVGFSWKVSPDVQLDPLLYSHPGVAELTKHHLDSFIAARDAYGDAKREDDYNPRRLEWLVWWTEWALTNCKFPTFGNS